MECSTISVLVADDSALMRRELKKIIEQSPGINVLACVRNGEEAVSKAKELNPDVVLLDINMPVMDGLTALQHIMLESPRPCVMVSSLTQDGALTSYEALELGAVDFVGKPSGTVSRDIARVGEEIVHKIRAAAGSTRRNLRLRRRSPAVIRAAVASIESLADRSHEDETPIHRRSRQRIIVIGQSTGGPNAIMQVLPELPADLGVPVIIVQHMPGTFTNSFAKRLDDCSALKFKEAATGDLLLPNHGFLAVGDMHLVLAPRHNLQSPPTLRVTATPAKTLHAPSVDITMESVVNAYGAGVIGVLLTGMGDDGARGMVRIRSAGGRTIAESEETAVVFGMPREAIRMGGAEFVLPAHEIGRKIVELVRS